MRADERHDQARARAQALMVVLAAIAVGEWEATPQTLDALASLAAAVVFDLDTADLDVAA